MLKKFRIEVEEPTADACVAALASYETALLVEEAQRFEIKYQPPVSYDDFERLFSRELVEEVIEYDPQIPGYRGRRVVRLPRVDNRRWAYDVEERNEEPHGFA